MMKSGEKMFGMTSVLAKHNAVYTNQPFMNHRLKIFDLYLLPPDFNTPHTHIV